MNNLKAKQCDPVGLHPKWNHQQIYSREINEKQKSLGNKKKTMGSKKAKKKKQQKRREKKLKARKKNKNKINQPPIGLNS